MALQARRRRFRFFFAKKCFFPRTQEEECSVGKKGGNRGGVGGVFSDGHWTLSVFSGTFSPIGRIAGEGVVGRSVRPSLPVTLPLAGVSSLPAPLGVSRGPLQISPSSSFCGAGSVLSGPAARAARRNFSCSTSRLC